MVHHVAFYRLRAEITPEKLEEMVRSARSQLMRVPEILTVRSGKKIDPENEWPFFLALDFESLDKKRIAESDPVFVKFIQTVIKPNVSDQWIVDYEMEPGRAVKYS